MHQKDEALGTRGEQEEVAEWQSDVRNTQMDKYANKQIEPRVTGRGLAWHRSFAHVVCVGLIGNIGCRSRHAVHHLPICEFAHLDI